MKSILGKRRGLSSMSVSVLLLLILMFVSLPLNSQNEVTNIWSRLYKRATTMERKMIMMQNIIEQHDRAMIPVMHEALIELNESRSNITDYKDQLIFQDLIRIIVRELGNLKAQEAAGAIKRVWDETEDNFIKAEAITALGKVNAREYSFDIAMLLRNININAIEIESIPQENSLVLACISALERIKKEEGFSPVFFASIGSYNRTVTQKADQAINRMIEDPSELIKEIILKEPVFSTKFKALQVEDESTASSENKADVAVIALKQGLNLEWTDRTDQTVLINIRILAMEMISVNAPNHPEGIELIASIVGTYQQYADSMFTSSEMINVLQALGQSSSDAAAVALSEFLLYLTERKDSGYTYQDDRVIRQTIISLGSTGNTIGTAALSEAAYGETWSNSLRREAKSALEKLKN